ncbi:MAG: hypothetical protein ACLFPH_10205 [Bacteroidales bacterium]
MGKKDQIQNEDIEKSKIYKEEDHVDFAYRFADNAKHSLDEFTEGMGEEYNETLEMAKFFYRYLEDKLHLNERKNPPTKEEVKQAIEQLKDMGRVGVFASVSILPGGGLSLIGLEILARKLGIKNFSFLPSAFRKRLYKKTKKDNLKH